MRNGKMTQKEQFVSRLLSNIQRSLEKHPNPSRALTMGTVLVETQEILKDYNLTAAAIQED